MPDDKAPEKTDTSSRRNPAPGASNTLDNASGEAVDDLIAGCRAGDRGAQRRLYELFHQRIYRLLARMVGPDAAADVTQQAFLQVFRKIDQFSGSGRFDRWLYRVAVNEAYQHLRRERQRRTQHLAYEPVDQTVRTDVRAEQKELMEEALARMEPELRTICLLREVEELSYREIAEILDIPEGTVGSRLNRARHELKKHLIRLGWEP